MSILTRYLRRVLDLDAVEANIEMLSHMWDLPDEEE